MSLHQPLIAALIGLRVHSPLLCGPLSQHATGRSSTAVTACIVTRATPSSRVLAERRGALLKSKMDSAELMELSEASKDASYTSPVRGLKANVDIPKGTAIAHVPLHAVLTAAAAAEMVRQLDPAVAARLREVIPQMETTAVGGATSGPQRIGNDANSSAPIERDLVCRDALWITAAVALLRRKSMTTTTASSSSGGSGNVAHAMGAYVKLFPSRVIPTLGHLALQLPSAPAPLNQRRLRGDDQTAIPLQLPAGATTADADAAEKRAVRDLVLQQAAKAVEMGSVATLGEAGPPMPTVEVVPNSSLMVAFFEGSVFDPSGHQTKRVADVELPAFYRHSFEMQHHLESMVLKPMAAAMAKGATKAPMDSPPHAEGTAHGTEDAEVDDDDITTANHPPSVVDTDAGDGAAAWLEDLRWAHFMMRSRAIVLPSPSTSTETGEKLGLVPVADMLNHDGIYPNVVVRSGSCPGGRPGDGLVLVATRHIAAGEELTMDYHSSRQLQRQRHEVGADPEKHRVISDSLRRIEQEQRYEMVKVDITAPAPKQAHALHRPRVKSSVTDEVRHVESELPARAFESEVAYRRVLNRKHAVDRKVAAVCDAEWAFRFAFVKTPLEREFEVSAAWAESLRDRVAKLTDIRRKGRPGEFVIGVPEGLANLKAERARLQQVSYHQQKVFPPQQR